MKLKEKKLEFCLHTVHHGIFPETWCIQYVRLLLLEEYLLNMATWRIEDGAIYDHLSKSQVF